MLNSCRSEIKENVVEVSLDSVEVTEKVKAKKNGSVSLAASAEANGASLLKRIGLKWNKKARLRKKFS